MEPEQSPEPDPPTPAEEAAEPHTGDLPLNGLEPIEKRLSQMNNQLTQIHDAISQNAKGEDRDAMLREMHNQLQEARSGVHWKILRAVLVDLVKLYDEIGRLQALQETNDDPANPLVSLREDVEDILYRQGFDQFQHEGEKFDGKRQQMVSKVESDSPDLVGTIHSRVAPGFASEDRVLRPEKVVVYGPPAPSSGK